MMLYLRLFYEFFKTGLFSVGGGLATLPFLTDIGARTGWFTAEKLADMVAVSESTPGPMGVNMATYVGSEVGGVLGAAVATLGLVAPSVIVILIIAAFLHKFRHNRWVEAVFYGLRPASMGLIASAGLSVAAGALLDLAAFQSGGGVESLFRWKALILAAAVLALTRWVKPAKKLHPIFFILASAAVGIVFKFAGE